MLQWSLRDAEPHRTMLRYYQKLIALRKSQPALRRPDRRGSHATGNEKTQVITLERWAEQQRLVCLMNFSKMAQQVMIEGTTGSKLFDSAATEWRGPHDSPAHATGNVTIQPESILIYERS